MTIPEKVLNCSNEERSAFIFINAHMNVPRYICKFLSVIQVNFLTRRENALSKYEKCNGATKT